MITDKRKLKNYFEKARGGLSNTCFLFDSDYVISDSYSIICLKDSNDLHVIKDDSDSSLYNRVKEFRQQFKFESKVLKEYIPDFNKEYDKIDDDFGIWNKKVKPIKNLIKANKFYICTLKNYYLKYIIKIENEKTQEVAYLLPCREV